jgi:hypothetical protein
MQPRLLADCRRSLFHGSLCHSQRADAMPTRHIAIAPDQLIIAAKKIADCVESYKASRYAGHYLIYL